MSPEDVEKCCKKFSIRSEIDRTNLKTSEAISCKVIFRGEGNINMLEPFKINFQNSFEVFDPIITDKTYIGNHNTGGTKIFEYILIPREKGNYTIPNVSFSYFNPETKEDVDYIEETLKDEFIDIHGTHDIYFDLMNFGSINWDELRDSLPNIDT